MKKTVNKILSVLLSAVMLLTLLPAFTASAADGPQEITEVFSAELFSDAAVNEFLKVFPQFASGIESALHSTPSDSPAYVELDPSGFSFSGDLYVKMNGDSDTATFAEFFHAYDVNVYPQTLGAYLEENDFGDIADALLAAEGWSDFDTGDGPAFDFDWGLDEIDGLAERYAAFTEVIALLIGAARPMFALALGTQDLTLNFPGEMQFFKIVSPSIHVEYGTGFTAINKDLTDVVFYDITGSAVFPSLGLYQAFVLPLYGALGVGTAIDYTFAAWNNSAEADVLAGLLFDPLYALVSAVQNDQDARETLISFYGDGCEERVAQIGAGCTPKRGEITVSDGEVDFQVTGGLNYVQSALKEALLFLFCEFGRAGFSFDVSAFADVDGIKDELSELLPALTAPAPEVLATGYCGAEGDGTNLTWTYTSDKVLTVSGTGAMADYRDEYDTPWSTCSFFKETVVIGEGVTHIGTYAFCNCIYLQQVTLPEGLLSIGTEAFSGCDIQKISLPESLMAVGEQAFAYNGISALYIPAALVEIGEGAFGMNPISSVTVDPGNPAYRTDKDNTLLNTAGTDLLLYPQEKSDKHYTVPAGVERICDYAFAGAVNLTGVELPVGVTEIGDSAFSGCWHLSEINFPKSLKSIGGSAFWCCNDLSDLTLPEGLTSIGGFAFLRCDSLTTVSIPASVTYFGPFIFRSCYGLRSITLPDTMTKIPDCMFSICESLAQITIPASVTQIGWGAFSDCGSLRYVFYGGSEETWTQIVKGGNNDPLLNARFYYNLGKCTPGAIVRENEIEAICCVPGGYDEVIYCTGCGAELLREHYETPTVDHEGQPQVWNIVPPTCTEDGEREIRTVCVYCAMILETTTEAIPATGHAWGPWTVVTPATTEAEGMEQRVCANDASHIETRAIPMLPPEEPDPEPDPNVVANGFCGGVGDGTNVSWTLTNDGTLTISGTGPMDANVYHWPMPWAEYKDSILAVQIGEGVETISASAFMDCKSLTSVSIPEGITQFGDWAFMYCENLTELVLPESLTQIGNYAFCGCSSLTDVTLPAGLTRIEAGTFSSCTGLSHVTIPEGVTHIGIWAFCNCAMTEITLPSTLEELGDYAFYENKLETVTIPDGITAIGEGVFGNGYDLQTVYLPQSIEQLGYHAFYYCSRLDHVYYDGLRTDWEQVEIDDECFYRMPVVHFADGTHLCAPGSPVSVTVEPSTCSAPGSYDEVYYCRECGEELYRETKEIEIRRHIWGEWTVVTPPTATEEGLMERHCIRDESHTETALIPAGEFGEHELLRGYCGGEGDGKNLIWTLTDDNVITISGEGPMADYGDYYIAVNHITNYSSESYRRGPDVPWPGEGNDLIQRWFALQGYYDDDDIMDLIVNGGIDWDALTDAVFSDDIPAYTVVVEPGVTYIGANAFAGTNVTALSLPATAEEIGYSAFYGLNCKDLVLPEGVRWVCAQAFSGGSYENLTLPASLEGIGGGAFQLDPGYDGRACTLTVLCPDERVNDILSGITVRGMLAGMAGIGSIEDYQNAVLVHYLTEAYYVIQHIDALLEEEISYFEEGMNITLTPQQRENVRAYYLWAYMFELRNFGVDFEFNEQSTEAVCNEINRILGTSFAPEELFEITETGNGSFEEIDIRLSPAADARFTERFGLDYDDVNTGWYYTSLNWLKENENTVIAPYLTLRGHCGSALESEYADTVPFEAVEHDPANGEVTREPTCTTPGERSVTCPVCGETFTEEIPALGGHCYQITVTAAPTCTENGETTYTCLLCGDTYTETMPALGHGTLDYDESGAPSTCIVRGYSMTICIACGEITDYTELPLDPTNHNWGEWTLVTPATYLTEGLEQRTCGWCGETEANVIPALVPDEVISDPDTGIELQLQEGVLPENTTFEVDEEFDGTYFRLLNREVGNVSSTLYNITPVADGEKVQPDGYVLVRLPIPAGYNPDTLSIYYISTETGATERMDCYIEDGYICFQTTHFSVYAIVDASAPAEAPAETPTNNGGGTSLSFFARISAFFQRIADFFKNLFRR